jgi:hypothetical protein
MRQAPSHREKPIEKGVGLLGLCRSDVPEGERHAEPGTGLAGWGEGLLVPASWLPLRE